MDLRSINPAPNAITGDGRAIAHEERLAEVVGRECANARASTWHACEKFPFAAVDLDLRTLKSEERDRITACYWGHGKDARRDGERVESITLAKPHARTSRGDPAALDLGISGDIPHDFKRRVGTEFHRIARLA